MKTNRMIIGIICTVFVVFSVITASMGFVAAANATEPTVSVPWSKDGAKKPVDYTFEEFSALSQLQKDAFIDTFDSVDAFNKWMDSVQGADLLSMPWEEDGAKKPTEYTFEEFSALSQSQKDAFIDTFKSVDEFNKWADNAQKSDPSEVVIPWTKDGAKKPTDYTFEEFNSLSTYLKNEFIATFESQEKFDEWVDKAQLKASQEASVATKSQADSGSAKSGGFSVWIIVICAMVAGGAVTAIVLVALRRKKTSSND